MRNPLGFRVETMVGGVIVFVVAAFFIGYFLIAMKNYSTEAESLNLNVPGIKEVIPRTELKAMRDWLDQNDPEFVKSSYRQAVSKYPEKPWISDVQKTQTNPTEN